MESNNLKRNDTYIRIPLLLIILFNKICHTDNLIVTMICAFLILVVFIPIIELTLKSFPWIIGKHK